MEGGKKRKKKMTMRPLMKVQTMLNIDNDEAFAEPTGKTGLRR